MKMIYYKLFTEWNAFFKALSAESAGKLIKAIAFFTDDLKKNQTLDLDPDERIESAIVKAEIDDPSLRSMAIVCCERLYMEFEISMNKSDKNSESGSKGGDQKRRNKLFADLWVKYPKKVGEDDARKAFNALDPDAETFEQILEGVERWKKSAQWQDAQFIPDLAKWIGKKRWTDDPPKPTKKKNPALAYEQKPISEADFNASVVNFDEYADDEDGSES